MWNIKVECAHQSINIESATTVATRNGRAHRPRGCAVAGLLGGTARRCAKCDPGSVSCAVQKCGPANKIHIVISSLQCSATCPNINARFSSVILLTSCCAATLRRCAINCLITCSRSTGSSLQNAMTSSEERTSAESRGLPHREVTDGLRRPPLMRRPPLISVLEQILGC